MPFQTLNSVDSAPRSQPSWKLAAFTVVAFFTLLALALTFVAREMPQSTSQADNVYVVTQHARSLSAMVAAGRYDFVNPAILPQNFPVEGESVVTVHMELVALPLVEEALPGGYRIRRSPSVAEAVALLKEKGYRPATVSELLALGEQYPKAQAGTTIVAAGSLWTVHVSPTVSHNAVASLTGYTDSQGNTQRMLEVFGAGVLGFRTNVVFAAVKN